MNVMNGKLIIEDCSIAGYNFRHCVIFSMQLGKLLLQIRLSHSPLVSGVLPSAKAECTL
jgi:hypothetical protein